MKSIKQKIIIILSLTGKDEVMPKRDIKYSKRAIRNRNIYFFTILIAIFGMIIYLDINSPIQNNKFNNLNIKISIILFILLLFIITFLRKKIIYFLELKNEKIFLFVSFFFWLLFIAFSSKAILIFINNFGVQKSVIVQTPIVKIIKKKYNFLVIKLDGIKQKMTYEKGYKVGDTYRLKIYTGCLGVKYYKDEDFDNGINGVIKESEKKSNSLLQK